MSIKRVRDLQYDSLPIKTARRRPPFRYFTCQHDPSACRVVSGACTVHCTSNGKPKVKCLVDADDAQYSMGSRKKVEFHCETCGHDFPARLGNITNGMWCGMCSAQWKHCGKNDCLFCHERSFASYDGVTLNGKRKVDCLVNTQDARLPKSSHAKVLFDCDVCGHEFPQKLFSTKNGKWCRMCSIQWKHCEKNDCKYCYERSFASYDGVTSNGEHKVDCLVNPEHARLPIFSNTKVLFDCDVCGHAFPAHLYNIANGKWCGMCSAKWKHCEKNDCRFCYERSFASYNGVTPTGKCKVKCLVNSAHARFAMSGRKKVQFKCDACENSFSTALYDITRGQWCPHCKNKTEAKVLRFLRNELKQKVTTQYTIRHEVRTYKKRFRFDFYLPAHGIILEVDGPQHTQEVDNKWIRSTLLHRQILDAWKERLARRNGLRVVRLDQPSIWRDSYDWRTEIKDILVQRTSN